MNFWTSSECYRPADEGLQRARNCVEPFLKAALAASSLAGLEGELRYIPIAMPPDMRARYPARSQLRKKERVYVSAPQLDYETFVNGTFEDQIREYLRGIALATPHLARLGASPAQVRDFEALLTNAIQHILAVRPDQTRH